MPIPLSVPSREKKDLKSVMLDGTDFWALVGKKRIANGWTSTNEGELAAFVSYALAFPNGFLALVDTYDTLDSGVPNFLAVALALVELGYKPKGIRLDSGDLAYFSKEARKKFIEVNTKNPSSGFDFSKLTIVASNDINEKVLYALAEQKHEIDAFGIGTNLVTCQAQPALGMVFKLVEIKGKSCIKLSNDVEKITIPGKKMAYRFYTKEHTALLDYLQSPDLPAPKVGEKILCRHPYDSSKRAYVNPTKVEPLLFPVWDSGKITCEPRSFDDLRGFAAQQLSEIREDHKRPANPAEYKVSLSTELYDHMHDLWNREAPIKELH